MLSEALALFEEGLEKLEQAKDETPSRLLSVAYTQMEIGVIVLQEAHARLDPAYVDKARTQIARIHEPAHAPC